MKNEQVETKPWKLSDWNCVYSASSKLPPMTDEEIAAAVKFLRDHSYPRPGDCPEDKCPKFRPACKVGICRIAVGMCGDF